ncbi:MAG: hypothetical protein QXP42_05700 [Candidatus Micrarchaeia archaeon]
MARFDVGIYVKLKIPDVVAETAFNTLVRRMGYADLLDALDREDYWLISLECANSDEARRTAEEIVMKCGAIYNKNKHTYRIALAGETLGDKSIDVLVWSKGEDGLAAYVKSTLVNTLGFKNVLDVKAGVLWKIYFKNSVSGDARKELAERIAVTKSRKEGLFVNPHSQDYKVLLR